MAFAYSSRPSPQLLIVFINHCSVGCQMVHDSDGLLYCNTHYLQAASLSEYSHDRDSPCRTKCNGRIALDMLHNNGCMKNRKRMRTSQCVGDTDTEERRHCGHDEEPLERVSAERHLRRSRSDRAVDREKETGEKDGYVEQCRYGPRSMVMATTYHSPYVSIQLSPLLLKITNPMLLLVTCPIRGTHLSTNISTWTSSSLSYSTTTYRCSVHVKKDKVQAWLLEE